MKWKLLTWSERIWVYNAFLWIPFILLAFAAFQWASGQKSLMLLALVGQIACFAGLIVVVVVSADRLFGHFGMHRGRHALMTRGLRSCRKSPAYAAVAHPQGDKLLLRVSRVIHLRRPWPLTMPVKLDQSGESAAQIDIDDQDELLRVWTSMADRARRLSQDHEEQQRKMNKSDLQAVRLNQQR